MSWCPPGSAEASPDQRRRRSSSAQIRFSAFSSREKPKSPVASALSPTASSSSLQKKSGFWTLWKPCGLRPSRLKAFRSKSPKAIPQALDWAKDAHRSALALLACTWRHPLRIRQLQAFDEERAGPSLWDWFGRQHTEAEIYLQKECRGSP